MIKAHVFVSKNNTNWGRRREMNINVLIPSRECSFKHREVARLVRPIVKGTTMHPKFTRKLKP